MSGALALLAVYLGFLSFSPACAFKILNVNNNCPISLDVFASAVFSGSVNPQASLQIGVDSEFSGTVSVDADDGTMANFFLAWDYYWIMRDPSKFNIGVSITPGDEPAVNGFCGTASCDSADCTDAFDINLNATELRPLPGDPPARPLHGCAYGVIYNVTWCPDGNIPDQSQIISAIHPMGDSSKCLDVRGGVQSDGTPVQVFDCNDTPAQQWIITRGNTQVRLANTNFCLDAGTNIANGVGMKIWECISGLAQQSWFYTNDDRISVTNHGQCLDVPNGDLTDGTQLQTFQCTSNDESQFFTS